jgi:nucleotide-binding universal stress UspA family protein
VAVDYRLVPGDSVLALVDVSSRARLMVLGRPRQRRGQRSWHHSVARAMLHQAWCPLVVVPPPSLTAPSTERPPAGAPVLVS